MHFLLRLPGHLRSAEGPNPHGPYPESKPMEPLKSRALTAETEKEQKMVRWTLQTSAPLSWTNQVTRSRQYSSEWKCPFALFQNENDWNRYKNYKNDCLCSGHQIFCLLALLNTEFALPPLPIALDRGIKLKGPVFSVKRPFSLNDR